ncbi:hypothetical protein BASA83_003806 [Batrachochytrium salamandrivorans]|nr:hypothetical protein BASA83_003806 [Batrachochytrium salamandrivorans]
MADRMSVWTAHMAAATKGNGSSVSMKSAAPSTAETMVHSPTLQYIKLSSPHPMQVISQERANPSFPVRELTYYMDGGKAYHRGQGKDYAPT